LMVFTESVSSDPDSFGTGAKLKETFDELMQEAKECLPASHQQKSRVGVYVQLRITLLIYHTSTGSGGNGDILC